MEPGRQVILRKRHRTAGVILRFGAKDVLHPEEGAVLSSDFPKSSASEMYHYSPGVEPPHPKPGPHLPLPKSFPAFQETAEGFVEYFVDLCGTFWEEDLISREIDAGQVVGFLWVLKDLHRKTERRWNISVRCSMRPSPTSARRCSARERGSCWRRGRRCLRTKS